MKTQYFNLELYIELYLNLYKKIYYTFKLKEKKRKITKNIFLLNHV